MYPSYNPPFLAIRTNMSVTTFKIGFGLVTALMLSSSLLSAAELIASTALSLRSAESTEPGAGYKDQGWSANASLSKQVDQWSFGGILSYSLSSLDQSANTSQKKPKGTSAVAMASRDIGGGRSVSATLGYGKNVAKTSEVSGGTVVTYTSNNDFLSSSIGLTQSLTLSRHSLAVLSARYTHVSSDQNGYNTSSGTNVPGSKSTFGFTTLGLGYSQRFGRYTPYAQLDWNMSNKPFIANDKDYAAISAGVNYRKNSTMNIGFSLSTVVGKAHSRDNSIGVSVSQAF